MNEAIDLLNNFAQAGFAVGPNKVRNKAVTEFLKPVFYWLNSLREEAITDHRINYSMCIAELQDEINSIIDEPLNIALNANQQTKEAKP
jgi:hypothetical protein